MRSFWAIFCRILRLCSSTAFSEARVYRSSSWAWMDMASDMTSPADIDQVVTIRSAVIYYLFCLWAKGSRFIKSCYDFMMVA